MSKELAVQNIQARLPMPKSLSDLDAGKWRVLCESVFPNAKSAESIVLALDYCKARKLDPFKRPVNIVPMWNKSLGKEVETIWPGINEVQTTAARTGKYAGMDEPKWGADKKRVFEGITKWKDNGSWKEENLKIEVTYPEWCSVTVYRMVEGQRCAFTEPVFWEEAYARRGKTEVPNDMWAKRSRGQLLKVAKAFSLRAAFPEEGEYVAEEMEGKEIAAGGVVIDQQSDMKPYETNESKPKSPFKTAAMRKEYQIGVQSAIKECQDIGSLMTVAELNKDKLDTLKESGDERDQMTVDEIRKSYQLRLSQLKQPEEPEDEESAPPHDELDERIAAHAAPYDDIPKFCRRG